MRGEDRRLGRMVDIILKQITKVPYRHITQSYDTMAFSLDIACTLIAHNIQATFDKRAAGDRKKQALAYSEAGVSDHPLHLANPNGNSRQIQVASTRCQLARKRRATSLIASLVFEALQGALFAAAF